MNDVKIKDLLQEFKVNKNVIEQLRSSFDIDSILDVAFKENMYDVILEIFKPIEIDGEVKIYFDIFSYVSKLGLAAFIEKFKVSESEKDDIIKSIYNIDIDKIKRIKIGDSLPRTISGWAHPITCINDVIYYAEPACLEAMIYLFNNNIRTTFNDTECAYGKSYETGKCLIRIDYDTLSDDNKNIADQLISMNVAEFCDEDDCRSISIEVSCSKNETVGSVSEKLKNLVGLFVKQPMLYGFFTKEQLFVEIRELIMKGINYDLPILNFDDIYVDYFMKLVESGKIKENVNGDIQTEDGRKFLIEDFINIFLNSSDFIKAYVDYYNYYYDEKEDKIWKSPELYKRYIESLKQMDSEQQLPYDDSSKKM